MSEQQQDRNTEHKYGTKGFQRSKEEAGLTSMSIFSDSALCLGTVLVALWSTLRVL